MNSTNSNPGKTICEERHECVAKLNTPRSNVIGNSPIQVKKEAFKNKGDQNFQLVRLLTTNPAAALPAIFTPSGKYEQRRAKVTGQIRGQVSAPVQTHQPHGFVQVPLNAAAHNVIRTATGQFFVSLPVHTESYPYLYATEDEMQQKGSCTDSSGYFDLDSILPIDCQMNTSLNKPNDIL